MMLLGSIQGFQLGDVAKNIAAMTAPNFISRGVEKTHNSCVDGEASPETRRDEGHESRPFMKDAR